MTTIAQEQTTPPIPYAGLERPVFVADDDQRARRLRMAAVAVLALASLWVAGLIVGMLGLGRLPGVSLPLPAAHAKAPTDESVASVPSVAPTASRRAPSRAHPVRLTASGAATKPVSARRGHARTRRTAPVADKVTVATTPRRKSAPATPPETAQPSTAQPSVPAPQRGWARRDWATPPGRATQTEPKQPPAAAPGQARKAAAAETDAAAATTAPLPPGQLNPKPDQPPKKS